MAPQAPTPGGKSAYAQTGSNSPGTGGVQSTGEFGGTGTGSGGTLSMAEIFQILAGATAPFDLVAARTGGSMSPDFQNAVGTEASATDPNNGINPVTGQPRPNYWATGQKIGVSRFQGTTTIPGRPLKQGEMMVDTTNLSGEALAHGTDRSWMMAHGYTPLTRADADGQYRQIKWMKTAVYQQNKDLLAKGGYTAHTPGLLGAVGINQTSKLVTQDEIKGKANLTSMTNMSTPTHLLSALYGMPQDDLITLQHKMDDAGYYQGTSRPVWGTADDATKDAYLAAMKDSLSHPGMTLDESIAAAGGQTMANLRAQRLSTQKQVDDQLASQRDAAIDSPETLRKNVRDTATTLLGRDVTPDEVDQLVNTMRGREATDAQNTYNAQRKSTLAQNGIVDDATLDRYVNQFTVQHADQFPGTVGALGMRPKEWGSWLAQLGMDPGTPFNAANERTVMKDMASNYYVKYKGNWQDVTTAMLAGPGAGWADISSGLAPAQTKGYGSSTNSKATEITGKFLGSQPPDTAGSTGTDSSITNVNLTDKFDPTAWLEDQLRKQHPGEVVRHELTGSGGLSDTFSGMVSKWGQS